jgi:hypothetical protein
MPGGERSRPFGESRLRSASDGSGRRVSFRRPFSAEKRPPQPVRAEAVCCAFHKKAPRQAATDWRFSSGTGASSKRVSLSPG